MRRTWAGPNKMPAPNGFMWRKSSRKGGWKSRPRRCFSQFLLRVNCGQPPSKRSTGEGLNFEPSLPRKWVSPPPETQKARALQGHLLSFSRAEEICNSTKVQEKVKAQVEAGSQTVCTLILEPICCPCDFFLRAKIADGAVSPKNTERDIGFVLDPPLFSPQAE